MSELLTRDDYQSIANTIKWPTQAFVDGKFMPAKSGSVMPTVNPATGEVIAEIAACEAEDVDFAVTKAREAFERGDWSRLHPAERKEIMIRLCKLLTRHERELAVLESVESGKPISDCVGGDLPDTIHTLKWHAETADKIYDELSPSGSDAVGMIVREPIGVVGCVVPWNFPLGTLSWKLGPALAAGNSIVVKPAEQTNMTALRLAELALEAGVPPGVLNVVTGYGHTAGQALGLHRDVNAISFTGSTEIGRKFLEYSAQSNLKRIVLELGGKSPSIVLDDAENLDYVAQQVTHAVFWNMGENCTANSRLIVQRGIKDELMAKIVARAREWKTGYPLDPQNHLGAMVTKEHLDRVMGFVEAGKKEGAEVVVGGEPIDDGKGVYMAPTIFDGVTAGMSVATDEIFGPVLSVMTVETPDEAVNLANDSDYGLQASLFTSSVTRAHRYARAIQAGTVTVNCYGEGDITTPFGGFKMSGFGGRDNSFQAHNQYTETKTIWIDLADHVEAV
ncbi:aldehyde dehydrogenase [Pelagibius sp. CAU 1746]|uniref:aldehyde dehydrogenase n=1 Tax=Pelagibius sp. CAU 1746 TaxID=3140370 RepID=UPI00325BDAC6